MGGSHHIARAAAIAVAMLATAASAADAPAPITAAPAPAITGPAPSVGGIAADMTLDAARAASPAVQWQNELSVHTKKPVAIWAENAFTLDGQSYRVSLHPFPSGMARLRLTSDQFVEKEKICRARVVALAAHFDAFFDKMEGPYSVWDTPQPAAPTITYNRLPGGAGYVSATPNFVDDGRDIDTLEAGRNARIKEVEYDDTDDIEWSTGQRAKADYPYALDMSAAFYEPAPLVCHIEATVTRYPRDREWPGRPSFDMLDTVKNKMVAKPSPELLHYSLEGVELPPEGPSLTNRCEINRVSGKVLFCSPHGREQAKAPIESAARQRMYAMAFDPKGLDPDNDQPLRTDITVKLSPSDRLPPEKLKTQSLKPGDPPPVPIMPSGPPALVPPPSPILSSAPRPVSVQPPAPVWTQTAGDPSRFYPREALSRELQARVVATCTITADLALACSSFEINPPEHTMFEEAARRILREYRVAPKLKNGQDAVGATVRVPIRFALPD